VSAATLTFHGAAGTVTGSCFEVAFGKRRVLVDCGLFQGPRSLEALNFGPFAFDPARIDAVLLTHAHLDHGGLLPRLAAEGFRGPVFCTPATRDLIGIMLPDAARIHEQEAARRNRRADRADEQPVLPLYTSADAQAAIDLARPVEFETQFEVAPGFQARFWNAGHILGSASVELFAGGSHLLFSGDLGPEHKSFHLDPNGPRGVDHLLCESTYGDRSREPVTIEERRTLLEGEVKAALKRGGNLLIPVFALERTQELLLDFAMLIDSGRIPHLQVFVDSPLASRATEIFRRHRRELEDLGDGDTFRHPRFHFVESVEQSMGLNAMSGAVILAASGMCEAGRIRHHLRHNLPRWDSTILFVGFQAQGTLGRAILEGAKRVRISGRDVAVRAHVRRIDSYSAHADREELVAWATARQPVKGSLFLTHGESGALDGLKAAVGTFMPSVLIPAIGETYELPAGAPARRLTTGRIELREVLRRDWQNDYADFAANLKRQLQRIESGRRRAEAIARMREVIDQYADHRRTPAGHRRSPARARPGCGRAWPGRSRWPSACIYKNSGATAMAAGAPACHAAFDNVRCRIPGSLASRASSTRAGPTGHLLPRSQWRRVATGTPIFRAKAVWLRPVRWRMAATSPPGGKWTRKPGTSSPRSQRRVCSMLSMRISKSSSFISRLQPARLTQVCRKEYTIFGDHEDASPIAPTLALPASGRNTVPP